MSVPSSSTFGRRLRALRVTLGMSQVELARRIGRHQTAIGPYERDEYEPPRDVVEKLALVLETSPEYLYFGRSPLQIALPVVGRIGRAGLLEAANEPTMELVQLRDQQLRGYRVRDDSMAPVFRPGQLALTLSRQPAGRRQRCWGATRWSSSPDGRVLLRRLLAEQRPRPLRPRCLQRTPSTHGRGAGGQIHCGCPMARGLARDRCRWSCQEHIPCG